MQVDWTISANDIVKTVIQGVGAVLLARLAIDWAVGRFQREKLFERRLALYTDIIQTLQNQQELITSARLALDGYRRVDKHEIMPKLGVVDQKIVELHALARMLLVSDVDLAITKFLQETAHLSGESTPQKLEDWAIKSRKLSERLVSIAQKELRLH